jgi:hypothetical protein
MPEKIQIYPFDTISLAALRAGNVTPLIDSYSASNLQFDGSLQLFSLGSSTPGALKLRLGPPDMMAQQAFASGEESGESIGIYALLLDADGNEILRVEALQSITDFVIDIEPGRTYLLILNGAPGTYASLSVDLPDTIAPVSIDLFPGFNLIHIPMDIGGISSAFAILPMLGDGSHIERVLRLNKTSGRYEEARYGNGGILSGDNFPIRNGEGLIIYSKVRKTVSFTGFSTCPSLYPLVGVNLVGIPCPTEDLTAFQLIQTIGGDTMVNSIQRYSSEKGAFETTGFDQTGQLVGVDFPIVPGEGYFVYMK